MKFKEALSNKNELEGTEKQIKWAKDIIQQKINYADKQIDKSLTSLEKEKFSKIKEILMNMVNHITDAKFWIEMKSFDTMTMSAIVKNHPNEYKKYWE